MFTAFTNGTLIDEAFADEMLRVKNFAPAISLEGFGEATDSRRGAGVYDRVLKAMEILHERKLIYGISCCYTSANYDAITSEEYYDMLIEKGAYFCWYFHYMPVGNDASPELLPSPEQRAEVYRRIRDYRNRKPLFCMDFQNDAEFVDGCIAGGRRYLHINANGDADPCAFIHYADSNIREKSLLDIMRSPLFMAYHDGQPFNSNMMQPAPCWRIRKSFVRSWRSPGRDPRTCSPPRRRSTFAPSATPMLPAGRPRPRSCGKRERHRKPLKLTPNNRGGHFR